MNVTQTKRNDAFKSLNDGKQTKWNQLGEKVPICRGSLAWLGRQTHNLENKGGQTPMSRGRGLEAKKARIPLPAPLIFDADAFCGNFRQQKAGYSYSLFMFACTAYLWVQ